METLDTNEAISEPDDEREQNIDVESLGEDSLDEWCFETDHVALKTNRDYTNLLKTVILLEGQRTQAVRNLDKIWDIKAEALQDPLEFIRKLQNGESLGIPPPIVVAQIPHIDWSQYKTGRPYLSRPAHGDTSKMTFDQIEEACGCQEERRLRVRGRDYDDSKPETFNQLWTSEEQRRLEELLLQFPPEPVEMRRWKKIAVALGNRTAKQVCSRVQKYFLKLHRAGLPVPGRVPKKVEGTRGKAHHHQRYNHMLMRPTTFFPDRPYFNESEGVSEDSRGNLESDDEFDDLMEDLRETSPAPGPSHMDEESSQEETEDSEDSDDDTMDISGKLEAANQRGVIELLERVKEEKEASDASDARHYGFKCLHCEAEPIAGSRWHCTVCADVDFCTDCVVAQLSTGRPHPLSHRLQLERAGSDRRDLDYASTGYNYLDPNFQPRRK